MFEKINAEYYTIQNIGDKINSFTTNTSFSILHVNIRSIKKNISNFQLFLSQIKHEFSIICLTETWCCDQSFRNDSNLQLLNYKSIHLGRQNKRGGGVCIFIHQKILFKQRIDITKLDDDFELLSIEIINKNCRNIVINNCYRPPGGRVNPL